MKSKRHYFIVAAAVAVAGSAALAQPPAYVRCVDHDSSQGGNGQTWANAFDTVQDAITAYHDLGGFTDIWVADGTYYPGSARTDSFVLANALAMYGGFAGNDHPVAPEDDISERDIFANVTILSGDMTGGKAYHVFTTPVDGGIGSTCVIDGFTIRDGCCDRPDGYGDNHGGAMYLQAACPSIVNCTFTQNVAGKLSGGNGVGGAISAIPRGTGGDPVTGLDDLNIFNCVFANNTATEYGWGGALHTEMDNTVIVNSLFHSNDATLKGGAIYVEVGAATLTNCTIADNHADSKGGGLYSYGGGTTVSAGNLAGNAASLQDDILNNGALVFDQASDGTYAGDLSGTGMLTKTVLSV